MKNEARPKAYSYVRWSTPEQSKGDSDRRQTEQARAYAEAKGLDLDPLSYVDTGVSAFRGKNVEGGKLGLFLQAVKDGDIPHGSFLLVESLDRVSRQTARKAVRTMEDIVEAGINLVDLSDGGRLYSADTLDNDSLAFMMMVVRFMRAHEESATKSRRLSAVYDKKRRDAAKGGQSDKPFTRMLPAWIRWDDRSKEHVPIPERARVVRTIFEKADEGWGQHRIAHWLNSKRTPTWGGARAAKYWHRSYVAKVLRNSAAMGVFTPHRTQKDETGKRVRTALSPIENYFPPVVDAALFERVAAKLGSTAARGRNANTGVVRSVVAGVAKCARCGGTVTRVTKGEHVYLVCSRANARAKGCKYLAVPYSAVEAALTTNARAIFNEAPRGKTTDELDRQIREADHRVDQLEDTTDNLARELGETSTPAVRRALAEAEKQLQEVIEHLRALRGHRDTLSSATVIKRLQRMRDTLLKKPLDVKEANRALREAVSRIIIDPEAARLSIHWRHAERPTEDIPFYSRHLKSKSIAAALKEAFE
ncbi:recombinase family protein [Pseudorhodoplanes sp.]|uniref:recombinase family protein n=1 Tax=Pseudorhodoplanes sp. TaxID=1934341 RepID=UPI00391C4B58